LKYLSIYQTETQSPSHDFHFLAAEFIPQIDFAEVNHDNRNHASTHDKGE
jgi:hypothetical protein